MSKQEYPDVSQGVILPHLDDPICSAVVSWRHGKVNGIWVDGVAGLSEDMVESVREWLREILDNWPNRPGEGK